MVWISVSPPQLQNGGREAEERAEELLLLKSEELKLSLREVESRCVSLIVGI